MKAAAEGRRGLGILKTIRVKDLSEICSQPRRDRWKHRIVSGVFLRTKKMPFLLRNLGPVLVDRVGTVQVLVSQASARWELMQSHLMDL